MPEATDPTTVQPDPFMAAAMKVEDTRNALSAAINNFHDLSAHLSAATSAIADTHQAFLTAMAEFTTIASDPLAPAEPPPAPAA